jgi:TetR/AcrR family transcriptional repressor of nem operon
LPSSASRRGPKPKSNTRSDLVQAGLRILHAQGYAATGIQSIVEEARVPKGSFYNHFPSKEAFGAEVLDAYFERNQEKLRAILGEANVPPLVRLKGYFDDRIEALRAAEFAKGCLLGNLSAEIADHSELLRERMLRQFGDWDGFFETCIAQAQKEGAISDQIPAAALARFVLNSWEGALLRTRVEKSDAALAEFRSVIFGKVLA